MVTVVGYLVVQLAKPEAPPACAPNCAGCPGCAPMGTQGGQPPAGTDGHTPDQPQ